MLKLCAENKMLVIFSIICSLIVTAQSARILAVVPTPSISHQVVFRPLVQELAKRGHQVTIITTDPVFPKGQAPENLTEIDLHDLSYTTWREAVLKGDVTSGSQNDVVTQMKTFLPLMTSVYEEQMKVPEVKDIITNKTQYDLLLLEAWVRPAMMFTHLNKNAAVVLVSSFGGISGNYDTVGAPARPPLLYPTLLRQRLVNLTLSEKLGELYNHYLFESLFTAEDAAVDKLIKKIIGHDTPSLRELDSRVDMMFLNFHPIWDMNRPVPPSVLYMGGMHQKPAKDLPKVTKNF